MKTKVNYDKYVNKHIKKSIGDYKLCKLNTLIIQQFYMDKSKNSRVENIIREAREFCDNKPVYVYIVIFYMKTMKSVFLAIMK